jgi:biopolymer transport protein ExbD
MDAVTKVSTDQKNIVLRADKSVPIENVVALMDVLNELNENFPEEDRYKMVLATEAK